VSSAAPPEAVWALLADVSTWPRWAPFDEAKVESGEGVGEIRRFRAGRVTTRERVVTMDPPNRYEYEFLSGLPIRGGRASRPSLANARSELVANGSLTAAG
jgi:uncharacterized protein YndB with AHSA1/START domain